MTFLLCMQSAYLSSNCPLLSLSKQVVSYFGPRAATGLRWRGYFQRLGVFENCSYWKGDIKQPKDSWPAGKLEVLTLIWAIELRILWRIIGFTKLRSASPACQGRLAKIICENTALNSHAPHPLSSSLWYLETEKKLHAWISQSLSTFSHMCT